jgi:N-acetylmuramoyl-L-alanine amidase
MAGLAVLKAPDMPAILLELGYLSNREDAARIRSVEGQKNIAIGLRRAVEIHFAKQMSTR